MLFSQVGVCFFVECPRFSGQKSVKNQLVIELAFFQTGTYFIKRLHGDISCFIPVIKLASFPEKGSFFNHWGGRKKKENFELPLKT